MAELSTNLKDYVEPGPDPKPVTQSNPSRIDESGRDASHVESGVYGAKGDPYTYRVNDDGSVTIMEGPDGAGTTMDKGAVHAAILGQIRSGQLRVGKGHMIANPGAHTGFDDMDAVAYPGGKEVPIVPTPLQRSKGREPVTEPQLERKPRFVLDAKERKANPDDKLRSVIEEEMKR